MKNAFFSRQSVDSHSTLIRGSFLASFAKRFAAFAFVMLFAIPQMWGASYYIAPYSANFSNGNLVAGANGSKQVLIYDGSELAVTTDVTLGSISSAGLYYNSTSASYSDLTTASKYGTSSSSSRSMQGIKLGAGSSMTISFTGKTISKVAIVGSCSSKDASKLVVGTTEISTKSKDVFVQEVTGPFENSVTITSNAKEYKLFAYLVIAEGESYDYEFAVGDHGISVPSGGSAASVELPGDDEVEGESGWDFDGWIATEDVKVGTETKTKGTKLAAGTKVTLTKATTFTAQWKVAATKSAIVYTNTKDADISALPTQYSEGTGIAEFPALADVDGYKFKAWNPSSIGTDATGEQTIAAEWEAMPTDIFKMVMKSFSSDVSKTSADGEFEVNSNYTSSIVGGTVKGGCINSSSKKVLSKNGTVALGGNDAYLKITLNDNLGLQEGDMISMEGGSVQMAITLNNETNGVNGLAANPATAVSTTSGSYTVQSQDLLQGARTIYVWRATGSSTAWTTIKITRPAQMEVTSRELTKVEINGTPISAENLATLKTAPDYLLSLPSSSLDAPVVKFTETLTYEDESQKTNTTEVTAEKQGEFFVAAATINEITYTVKTVALQSISVKYYDHSTLLLTENIESGSIPQKADEAKAKVSAEADFGGWFTSETYETPVDLTQPISTDTDVYGDWDYTITWNLNDGNWNGTEGKASYHFNDEDYTLPTNVVKTDKVFDHWELDYDLSKQTKLAKGSWGDVTYNAIWKDKTYAQSINMEQFVLDNSKKGNWKNYLTTNGYDYTVDSGTSLDSLVNDPNKPASNYMYLGLKIKESGKKIEGVVSEGKLVIVKMGNLAGAKMQIDGADSPTALKAGSAADSVGGFTYYYSENEATYSLVTTAEGANVLMALTITDPYKVTFTNGGEIEPMFFKGTALTLPAATGEGEFQGWFDEETGGKKIGMNGDKFVPTSDIILYAQFSSTSTDNTLKWLKYGEESITVVPNQVEYNVTLPHDSNLPTVTYEANSEKATAGEVTQATAQTMKATFTVTAESGAEANYSVIFEYEKVLTAMAEGTYAKAVIAPASVSGTSSQYAAGLSENAYFNTLGDESKADGEAGTPEFKNEYIYLKGAAQMSGAIPTSRAIQFIIGTRGKLTISGKGDMRMIKEGETEAAVIGTTTAGDYEVSVLPGTYYIYATAGSRNITNIKYEIPPMGTDATLKSLKVAGYALTPEFDAETTDYSVVLDYGTTELPNVLFEKNDEFASAVKTDAESVTGTTTIEVTAEDGVTVKTYSIAFSVSTDPKFVIFDGSKMTDFGPKTFTDPVSGMSWVIGSSLSYDKNNDALSCGAKDYAHDLKMTPAKEKDGKAIRINVPEGKVCIINLVGCTGSSGNSRSVFIAKSDQAGVEDALIAYTSDQYVLEKKSVKVLGGSYYVRASASCRFYEISVEISDYDYTETVRVGQYSTICLEYDVALDHAVGANFYEIENMDGKLMNFVAVEGQLNGGQAYLVEPTANMIGFVFTGTEPKDALTGADANGFIGSYERIEAGNLAGMHGIVGNKVQPLGAGASMKAHHAYLDFNYIPTPQENVAAPTRRRICFGTSQANTPTDIESIMMNEGVTKFIRNNQLYILRDGKLFNAQGAMMK